MRMPGDCSPLKFTRPKVPARIGDNGRMSAPPPVSSPTHGIDNMGVYERVLRPNERAVTLLNAPTDYMDRDRAQCAMRCAYIALGVPSRCASEAHLEQEHIGDYGHWFMKGPAAFLASTRRPRHDLFGWTQLSRFRIRAPVCVAEAGASCRKVLAASCAWRAKFVVGASKGNDARRRVPPSTLCAL